MLKSFCNYYIGGINMELLIVGFIIISGIVTINDRNEQFGLFSAIKSLFMLLIILGCIGLCLSGVGAIIGIPVLWCIARSASSKM